MHRVQRFFTQRPFERLLVHHLQIALQHGQRRAQLMADVGEEIAPRAFELMHLRNVARHHQQLIFAVRHDAKLKVTAVIQHQMQWPVELLAAQIAREFRVAQQV